MDDRGVLRRVLAATTAAAAILALAACSPPAPPDGGPDGVRAGGFHLAQVERSLPTEDRELRTIRVDAPPANADEWTVDAVDPTSRDVRLSWTDGTCASADRLAVQETASTVAIGITTSKPYDGVCSGVGIPRSTTVVLRRPLGGRALMEGTTGVDDGLPTVTAPGPLPEPTCGSSVPADAPAGMADAAERMAPTAATTAFVCRTWWPKGAARTASRTITDHAVVAALVAAVNEGVGRAGPGPVPVRSCPRRVHESWYAVWFRGEGLQVEVRIDGITCSTATNGARSGTASAALLARLGALFG